MSRAFSLLSPPQQALHLLQLGGLKMGPEWDKAHGICQTAEGTFEYDLVHALAHWIEGDAGNRDYWYARVGRGWRRADTIAAEWESIFQRLSAKPQA